VLCGVLFGEYCSFLDVVGQAYVGLLQMTVLPYVTVAIVAKLGRLDLTQARRLGKVALVILLLFWLLGVALVVAVSIMLPPVDGAAFFSPKPIEPTEGASDFLTMFIPANIYHALAGNVVPAVVVFCLFFGAALISVPGKEPLLDFLDLCSDGLSRINLFLVRLAPFGLFALTAAAAGTMGFDELSRLQAYLIMFTLACLVAAFGVLPLLVSSLTPVSYRKFLRSAQEPMLTAIATGKLFVVLPQIVDKCEELTDPAYDPSHHPPGHSTASVLVPLAYPFPHLGKILAFVFVSFAAWYVGRDLQPGETTYMATTGASASFASPLITIPFLLDMFQLPQDLMPLFLAPGFITTRLADVVGVAHLMALTVIASHALQGTLQVRWRPLCFSTLGLVACLSLAVGMSRWYLTTTAPSYDLDNRMLSLEIASPHLDTVVYRDGDEIPPRTVPTGDTLTTVAHGGVLRVGYHADHLPYSFFNNKGDLVGYDVELMHRLADRLQVRLEFVPWTYENVVEELGRGDIDVAVGGLIMNPERLLRVAFTAPYTTATLAVVIRDHQRGQFATWESTDARRDLHLAVVGQDMAAAARRQLPRDQIESIASIRQFFDEHPGGATGLVTSAEEGAAWNILHPEYTVVAPEPVIQRPVCMAVRLNDLNWVEFLNRWLDYERLDGSLERERIFWIEGGGAKTRPPRWSVFQNVLGWLP
jgi:Na+/H+-dicarboxylate symporter/ABC-type amino acid transport substrate-binding protein